MSTQNTANAYLQTRVMSASPEELRLMLIEGALKFAIQGRDWLENKDHEQAFTGFSQCRPIILELINTIKPDPDPKLAERVRSLYTFMFAELAQAGYDRDIPRINKVIELLEYERETWVLLMDQVAAERGVETKAAGTTAAKPAPTAQAGVAGSIPTASTDSTIEPNARPSFSVQG